MKYMKILISFFYSLKCKLKLAAIPYDSACALIIIFITVIRQMLIFHCKNKRCKNSDILERNVAEEEKRRRREGETKKKRNLVW